jgi:hypothetical protein
VARLVFIYQVLVETAVTHLFKDLPPRLVAVAEAVLTPLEMVSLVVQAVVLVLLMAVELQQVAVIPQVKVMLVVMHQRLLLL